jgi:hypothetical protein
VLELILLFRRHSKKEKGINERDKEGVFVSPSFVFFLFSLDPHKDFFFPAVSLFFFPVHTPREGGEKKKSQMSKPNGKTRGAHSESESDSDDEPKKKEAKKPVKKKKKKSDDEDDPKPAKRKPKSDDDDDEPKGKKKPAPKKKPKPDDEPKPKKPADKRPAKSKKTKAVSSDEDDDRKPKPPAAVVHVAPANDIVPMLVATRPPEEKPEDRVVVRKSSESEDIVSVSAPRNNQFRIQTEPDGMPTSWGASSPLFPASTPWFPKSTPPMIPRTQPFVNGSFHFSNAVSQDPSSPMVRGNGRPMMASVSKQPVEQKRPAPPLPPAPVAIPYHTPMPPIDVAHGTVMEEARNKRRQSSDSHAWVYGPDLAVKDLVHLFKGSTATHIRTAMPAPLLRHHLPAKTASNDFGRRYISPKLDGKQVYIVMRMNASSYPQSESFYLFSRSVHPHDGEETKRINSHFKDLCSQELVKRWEGVTILMAEYIKLGDTPIFFVFDIAQVFDTPVVDLPFSTRYAIYVQLVNEWCIDFRATEFQLVWKPFYHLKLLPALLGRISNGTWAVQHDLDARAIPSALHPGSVVQLTAKRVLADGVVLQHPDCVLTPDREDTVLKYRRVHPVDLVITVDAQDRIAPSTYTLSVDTFKPPGRHRIGVGKCESDEVRREIQQHAQTSSSLVVECCRGTESGFAITKVRSPDEKTHGNALHTVIATMNQWADPVTEEQLLNAVYILFH